MIQLTHVQVRVQQNVLDANLMSKRTGTYKNWNSQLLVNKGLSRDKSTMTWNQGY